MLAESSTNSTAAASLRCSPSTNGRNATSPCDSSASGRRLGTVVHREELTRLLLYLVDDSATLEDAAKAELKQVLARNGITDPAGTLKKIRDVSMQLEAADPHLAVDVRQTLAIRRCSAQSRRM